MEIAEQKGAAKMSLIIGDDAPEVQKTLEFIGFEEVNSKHGVTELSVELS